MSDILASARAPGKIIISGEHAVVHGAPALVVAINAFCYCQVVPRSTTFATSNIKQRYEAYLQQQLPIEQVITDLDEFLDYIISYFYQEIANTTPPAIKLKLNLALPPKSGQGASAAVIVSAVTALNHYSNCQLSPEKLYPFCLILENLLHGKSSGIDIIASLQGGAIYVENEQRQQTSTPDFPLFYYHTGTPQATTGECVQHSKKVFAEKPQLLNAFHECTQKIFQAWQQQDLNIFLAQIKINHRLLQALGVVPDKVSTLISNIEQQGGAAKICGAGSITGDHGGAVLAVLPQENPLEATPLTICQQGATAC